MMSLSLRKRAIERRILTTVYYSSSCFVTRSNSLSIFHPYSSLSSSLSSVQRILSREQDCKYRHFHRNKTASDGTAQEDDMRKWTEYHNSLEKVEQNAKFYRRKYLMSFLLVSLLISALLAAGVVLCDRYFHRKDGDTGGPVLLDQPNAILQNLVLDIRRYPALYVIFGLNALVWAGLRFGFARNSALTSLFFSKHLVLNINNVLINGKRFYTLLTSNFTHVQAFHIGLNMYALYNMAPLLLANLGTITFSTFYISAALVSGFGSLIADLARGRISKGSIGASGAVFAVLAASIALMSDDARVSLIFLPSSISFNPKTFFPLYLIGEIIFNLVQKRVQLGTASHVTGALFGYLIMSLLLKEEHNQKPRNISLSMRDYHYVGQVANFRMNGLGKMTTNDLVYSGEMKDDKFHGYGLLQMQKGPQKLTYSGQFEKGLFHGQGTLILFDQNGRQTKKIVGFFHEGKPLHAKVL